MSVEDDTDLRDLVAQTLEANGCLAKIRAQLRAGIFLALEEEENLNQKQPLSNNRLKTCLQASEGKVMFCIVREFLEYFGLECTISVFEPESYLGTHYKYEGRSRIIEDLGVSGLEENSPQPILLQLVNLALQNKLPQCIKISLNNANLENGKDFEDHKTDDAYSAETTRRTDTAVTTENSISEYIDKSEYSYENDKVNLNATINISCPTLNAPHVKVDGNNENTPCLKLEADKSLDSITEENSDSQSVEVDKSPVHHNSEDNAQTVSEHEFSPILKDNKVKFSSPRSEKFKPKTTLSSLADLPPLQLSKARANDSLILPSLYNRDFKEKAKETDTDKFLNANAMDNYEEELLSLSEINSTCSEHSKCLTNRLNNIIETANGNLCNEFDEKSDSSKVIVDQNFKGTNPGRTKENIYE